MNRHATASLGLTLGLWMGLTAARADDSGWRPIGPAPIIARTRPAPDSPRRPTVTLGRPLQMDQDEPAAVPISPIRVTLGAPVAQASYVLAEEAAPRTVFRLQGPDGPPPPPPPPGGGGPIAAPITAIPGGDPYANGAVTPGAGGNFFTEGWGQFKDTFHRHCGQGYHSDLEHDFAHFSSPVSSPFLTEDPRSLTEVKPLFIYQHIPNDNPLLKGGNIEFFGLQARLSLTEKWSIVMNKFGGLALQPDDQTLAQDTSGFSELWIGPKFTFYRDPVNNTAAAVGLTVQLPIGSSKLFQDTGTLSLSPYFSFAKSFGKLPAGYGNFNYMSTTGFSFGIDSERSDYFYSNIHLDFDVAGQHRLYPLIELNYTRYVNRGNSQPLNFEGGDLINFGSQFIGKENLFTLATGARYKVGGLDNIQVGAAVEFPLNSKKDFNDFRILIDVIFRY